MDSQITKLIEVAWTYVLCLPIQHGVIHTYLLYAIANCDINLVYNSPIHSFIHLFTIFIISSNTVYQYIVLSSYEYYYYHETINNNITVI